MKKRIEDFSVRDIQLLNKNFFVLTLQAKSDLPEILPGQFAQIKVEKSPNTFLRRPFSIYDVDYNTKSIYFLIKIVGEGTLQLSQLEKGSKINIIYPLGNSFSLPYAQNVLLIGGGTGVAPMLILARYICEKTSITPEFILGYRSSDQVVEIDRFKALGKVNITTEDGSEGIKGIVTDHPVLDQKNSKISMIYTCGPELMMKAVASHALKNDIPCEVSLENMMGCGIGACLCCVVDTIDRGNLNTCTEGPVFNTQKLKWLI